MLTRTLRVPALLGMSLLAACGSDDRPDKPESPLDPDLVAEGRKTFRFDTFGDEARWTDTLRMYEVIAAQVDPVTALSVGLKVDAEALPPPSCKASRMAAWTCAARKPRSRCSS